MYRPLCLTLALALTLAPRLLGSGPSAPPETVAIVCCVEGSVTLRPAVGAPAEPLAAYRRLAPGAVVETAAKSTVTIVFFDGQRLALQPEARAVVGRSGLTVSSGQVRRLEPVPVIVNLARLLRDGAPRWRTPAVRIRGGGNPAAVVSGLEPRDGMPTLRSATTLAFAPVPEVETYHVEVVDENGQVAFTQDVPGRHVEIPGDLLRPGTSYSWWVEPKVPPHPEMRGEAVFRTLNEREESARSALAARRDEPDLALLLAEVDRTLGASEPTTGVVIEEVEKGSLGERAGLQLGDVILSWCRPTQAGYPSCIAPQAIDSPFAFVDVEIEQAPRGGVRLLGRRGAEEAIWSLGPGSLEVEIRPVISGELGDLYRQAHELTAKGHSEAAVERWRAGAAKAGDGWLAAWFLARAAKTLAAGKEWKEADVLYAEAIDRAKRTAGRQSASQLLLEWGNTWRSRGLWKEAAERYRRSLDFAGEGSAENLGVANALNALGVIEGRRNDPDAAERYFRQALLLRERLAPGSLPLAATLKDLGNVAILRGDAAAAAGLLARAQVIEEALVPRSLAVASTLINRSIVDNTLNQPAQAEECLWHAVSILEEVKPESLELAMALQNLSIQASEHGDYDLAADLLRRSLALKEKLDPSGLSLASTLHSLALVAEAHEDLQAADQYLRRSLSIETRDRRDIADRLSDLARVARLRGDLGSAEEYGRRALAMREQTSPESLFVADSLNGLGETALERHDLDLAESYFRRAMAIAQKVAPERRVLAHSLRDLGEVLGRQGRRRESTELICRAVDLVERETWRPAGARLARSSVPAASKLFYESCLAARADLGQPAEAFRILEQGRARTFREQLAERDLFFTSELPPEAGQERKALDAEYDRVQSQLDGLSLDRDKTEIERLRLRLEEIQTRQQEIVVKARERSPRFASLRSPQALDLTAARRSLDPGTVLLAYSVGLKNTYLFVVQPLRQRGPGIAVFALPVGAKALRSAVGTFLTLLESGASDRRAIAAQGQKLYDLLLRPAERELAGASRLLLSPDGPLHTLPFAALIRKGDFLAEWKPLHSVLSATVYAEIRKSRRSSKLPVASELVAFGAPTYARLEANPRGAPASTLEVLSAVHRGLSLEPLPASRREIETIGSLFPHARIFLGSEATEERAKAVAPQARFLHFACHGFLDERFPLNSGLALSMPEHPAPGQDNGLLQAWEIFDQMRLDADLVTLSACDSGLGKEMGGEGLIGLTRAFQYAGARSVLASLWSVADDSTAELMRRFYGYLKQGRSKDEALRAAQVDLIHGPEATSHPYFWAAFQLSGDWR